MIRKINIGALILTLLFASCESWLDVNDNPNYPDDTGYEVVLPSGITSVVYVMGGRYQVLGSLWSEHWTQSLGASQYAGIDSYDINSSSFDDNQFGELYTGALKAFEYVRKGSAAEEQWNYYLIATVMQSYTFQVLADLYDQIPFSEALAGDMNNLTPRYERGQDIYDSLIVRIDKALAKDLDRDDLKDPGKNDVIFGGVMARWVEFANTLKLKLYLRQSEVRPDIARTGIEELYAGNADFLSADAAFDHFEDQSGQRNPLYETDINVFGGNPNLVLSRTLHSYLLENDDYSRLNLMFYTPQAGGAHKSLVQGNYNDPDEPAGTNSSSYSKPILLPREKVYLMSYSEACFLQAEAIIRYNTESYSVAREKYNAGLSAAYTRLLVLSDLTQEEKDNLIQSFVNGRYRFTTEGSPLEEFLERIIVQKWVSLAGVQSLETFFEHNRTHYPKVSDVLPDNDLYEPGSFTVSVNNVTSGRFPKRLLFPESEVTSNPNTPPQMPVWTKVWWDVKPEEN
jgi:hypothetical protein